MTAAADHEAERGEAEQERLRKLFCELTHAPKYKFPRDHERINAPADRGVYVIYDPNGEPAHVGMTPRAKSGIRQRLKDHLAGDSKGGGNQLY
jgi:hypothetical protein